MPNFVSLAFIITASYVFTHTPDGRGSIDVANDPELEIIYFVGSAMPPYACYKVSIPFFLPFSMYEGFNNQENPNLF